MKYSKTTFTITCEPALKEAVYALLSDAVAEMGYESFEEEGDKLLGYIQTSMYHKEQLDSKLAEIPIPNIDITYETQDVEEQNWNEEWEKSGFEPILIENKMVIYDARNQQKEAIQSLYPEAQCIGIEARQAFGTGTHETTRMIISTLTGMSLQGKRVLDCGCGTGILGIAASKLGAGEIVGYDIDEWCVENTTHNALLNDVTNIEVLHGDANALSHVCGLFDVVIANINRNILLADMPHFTSVMTDKATLILSGFYTEDMPLIAEKAAEYGFNAYTHKEENNWACMVLTHAE